MNISEIAHNKALCCGCNACAAICPKHAIQMVEDSVGQLYPRIDEEKCVGCSLCSKICCEKNDVPQLMPFKTVAASYKNKAVSAKSSSGGIFAAFAEAILKRDGIVYGTMFSGDFNAQVVGIETAADLEKLQGSKYVRSSMSNVYADIKSQLDAGRIVLFSGVPCQVAALTQYLGKPYSNLARIDIVCHGTPSNKMFLDYLTFLQRKTGKQVSEFYFRDKSIGQDTKGKIIYTQDQQGKIIYTQEQLQAFRSSYYKLFLNCVTFRESCYNCKFAAPERVGDITLCDYWGIEEVHPEFVQKASKDGLIGISAVLVNTEAGKRLFDQIEDQLLQMDTDYSAVRQYNPQLNHPSLRTDEHEQVMRLYAENGYDAVDQYYFSHYRTKILISTLGQALPEKTKKKMLEMKRKLLE